MRSVSTPPNEPTEPSAADRFAEGTRGVPLAFKIAAVVVIGFVATGGWFGFDLVFTRLVEGVLFGWTLLKAAPAPAFFAVMAIALLGPVPASPFYITAGPLYGIGPSLFWIAPALAVNALLVHILAGSLLRPSLERTLARAGRNVPTLNSETDQTLLILVVRLTPGIPYFIQNWILGLARVKRVPFILLSVAIQMVYAAGFVILGRSAFEGRAGLALGALALLVLAVVLARIAHLRLTSGSPNKKATPPP